MRSSRDRIGQQPGLRSLPELAGDDPTEHPLFIRGQRREQTLHQQLAAGLRAHAGNCAELGEPAIDLAHRERSRLCGGRHVPQARPAHADLALAHLPDEIRSSSLDLAWVAIGGKRRQRPGQQTDLRPSRRRGGHRRRRPGQVCEEHDPIIPAGSDIRRSALSRTRS